jgi:hypothetical protein
LVESVSTALTLWTRAAQILIQAAAAVAAQVAVVRFM